MTTETPPAQSPAEERRCTWMGVCFARPRLWPVLITIGLVGLCIFLGVWQLQRLAWKEGLIAELEQAQQQQPITTEALPQELGQLTEKNFHSVALLGDYDYDVEFHVIGRSNTEEPGYYVLSPFHIAGDERVVLVNRGWVPQHKKEAETRREENISTDSVYLSGYILVPQGGSPFLPAHDVENNIWFWQDTQAMAAAAQTVFPAFVIQRIEPDAPAGIFPQSRTAFDVQLRNDHFAYALMWFSLALAGCVIFVLYHYRPKSAGAET